MLRRRRVASLAESMAARLLERAVGTAERLGEAMRLVERAWSSRHDLAGVVGSRRVTEVTVVRSRSVPPARAEPVPGRPASSTSPPAEPVAWALARHLATTFEQRRRRLDLDPWAVGADRVETVRQVRVASRRLRVFVQLFGADLPPKTARRTRRALRHIGRTLGPLRELDAHVQMLDALRADATTPEQRVAVEHVLEQVEQRRDRIEARTRKKLATTDWARLREDLEEVIDRVVGPLVRTEIDATAWARQRLWPRLEQAFAGMPDPSATTELEALHEIRIAAKRMRYAIDLVRPALGDAERALRSRLRATQRVLGAHRDTTQLHAVLTELQGDLESRGRVALSAALAGRIDRLEARRARARGRIGPVLAELVTARAQVLSLPAASDRPTDPDT
jgi:CHAD domain-containing protein